MAFLAHPLARMLLNWHFRSDNFNSEKCFANTFNSTIVGLILKPKESVIIGRECEMRSDARRVTDHRCGKNMMNSLL